MTAASLGDPERQPFLALLSQRPVTRQLFAVTVQAALLMSQMPASVASLPLGVQLHVPQSCGQLFAATVQEPPLMLRTPAFVASVPLAVQTQWSPNWQLLAATVHETPLMLQTPASVASVRSAVQPHVPQSCGLLFAATTQEAPATPRVPALFASVLLGVQMQIGVVSQLFAETVQEVPLMRQMPALAVSVSRCTHCRRRLHRSVLAPPRLGQPTAPNRTGRPRLEIVT